MEWIFYSLLAAMLWAVVNVTDKYTMVKLVDRPTVPIFLLGIIGFITAGIIYCLRGVNIFHIAELTLAFISGALYVLTMYFYYQAVQREEVSKVIPLYYLSPVFILFIAEWFLNESLTASQYGGIIFLVCGALLISLPYPIRLKFSIGVLYILLAAFCYAISVVITKYLLKNHAFWDVFALVRVSIFIFLLPLFLWKYKMSNHIKIGVQAYSIMILNQILNLAGVFCLTIAMTSGYVTLVNAVTSMQPFFVLLLATILGLFLPDLFKERFYGAILIKKCLGIIFMFLGVILVS